MTTVDELFAAMEAPKVDRVILTIDENLRIIDIPNLAVVIGAEGDKDVNRLYFKMDRLYRGTDLAAFTPRINYINAAGKNYYYDVTDLTIEGDSLTFSWLIRAQAAGVACSVESRKGCLRLFSRRIPDADLDIILTLFGVGTLNYFLAVPTADWTPLRPTIGPNQYYCDVAVKNCTSDMIPLGMTDLVNWEEAENAGMASVLSTGDGYVRFYAVRRPEANIHVNVILLKREEPVNRPATKTELGLVMIGDGMDVTAAGRISTRGATNEEFRTAMQDAFGEVDGWRM